MNVKISALRSDLAAIVKSVEADKKRYTICRHHDPVAVLVSVEELRELDELRSLYRFRAKGRIPN